MQIKSTPLNTNTLPPVIVLMGPTASGKSALAVQLAHALNGEIISVDSALVYKGMNIGTAKPTPTERSGIPHHLIDIIDASESYSTGQFRSQSIALLADIISRGKLPILVGGTMLYFNALLNGLAVLPPANPEIRAQLDLELESFGKETLHQRLAAIDPVAAARIHPNDPQRVQRALEVFQISGKALSEFFMPDQVDVLPYHFIKLIVAPTDRKVLHEIIARRFHLMLEQGFMDEVEVLFARGDLNEKMPAIRAVGYRQAWSYLQGDDDMATMTEKAIIATRQLAKRQFTWLRKETDAQHFETGQVDLAAQVINYIKNQ